MVCEGDDLFIMFGWVKEGAASGPDFSCYCYRCQKQRSWEQWKVTEWVSFFTIKTIPFLSKSHAVCGACRESFELDGVGARTPENDAQRAGRVVFLEERQLAGKSAVQRSYLLAQRDQGRPLQ